MAVLFPAWIAFEREERNQVRENVSSPSRAPLSSRG